MGNLGYDGAQVIPQTPATDADLRDWQQWANRHYPYSNRYRFWMLYTRKESPHPATEEALADLRGIPDDGNFWILRGILARQFFVGIERHADIEREQRMTKAAEQRKERQRLIGLARSAKTGTLGNGKAQQANAKSTAQTFLGIGDPESETTEALQDWHAMHIYGLAVSAGKNIKRPVLNRDRKAQAQQRRDLRDIDDAIGAVSSTAAPSVEQRSLF